jgi:hypothetical protein
MDIPRFWRPVVKRKTENDDRRPAGHGDGSMERAFSAGPRPPVATTGRGFMGVRR